MSDGPDKDARLQDERDALDKAQDEGALSLDLELSIRRIKALNAFLSVLRSKGFKE